MDAILRGLPIEVARNHVPITMPASRCGASLLMLDRPTGEMHSSAQVAKK